MSIHCGIYILLQTIRKNLRQNSKIYDYYVLKLNLSDSV